jgi:hypothetical protein
VLVRTRARSEADAGRSWLLIKHRDDWAGAIDVAKVAPLSVKSFGDFEDILAADNPDIWESDRPAKGGTAGKMLATIIRKAAEKKAAVAESAPTSARGSRKKAARARKPKA